MLVDVLNVLPIEIWILMNHYPPASSIYLSFPLLIPHRIWRPLHKKEHWIVLACTFSSSSTFIWSKDHRRDGGIASRADALQEERFHLNRSAALERRRWDIVHLICLWCKAKPLGREWTMKGEKMPQMVLYEYCSILFLKMRDFRFLIIGSLG